MSTDWIPAELVRAGPRRLVRWIHPGNAPLFTEPFFHHTIDALTAAHAPHKLTALDALADVAPVAPPRGFIFHVARCGSTLVSRSLAAVARHRVIAEAGPVNQLLLADDIDPAHKPALLRGLIYSLCGSAGATDCCIKFSSWNLLYLDQIRALFPATPWIFVYRAPADVLRSLLASPPRWAAVQPVMGPAGAGPAAMAATLERVLRAPRPHWGPLARAVNYTELPDALPAIAAHFGLALDAGEQAQVMRMARYDAKQPGQVAFQRPLRAPLPPGLADALAPLDALYRQWEALRSAQARDVR